MKYEKSIQLTDAIGEKYILLGADPAALLKKKGRQRFPIRLVMGIAACLALTLTAVFAAVIILGIRLIPEDELGPVDNTIGEIERKPQYTLYFLDSAGQMMGTELIDKNTGESVSLEQAESKIFSFYTKTEVVRPDNIPEQYSVTLGGKTYVLDYRSTLETVIASSEKFSKYGRLVEYQTEMDPDTSPYTVRAEIRPYTNELLLFAILSGKALKARGNLTEEGARTAADAALLSLYGESAGQEYSYDTTVYTDDQSVTQYTVVYRKVVWGMPTNDAIQISVNMKGEIVGINAKYLGMYSSAENDIQKSDLDNAAAVLREALSDSWTILETTLIIDSEGDYYIRALTARSTSDGLDAAEVYINVT